MLRPAAIPSSRPRRRVSAGSTAIRTTRSSSISPSPRSVGRENVVLRRDSRVACEPAIDDAGLGNLGALGKRLAVSGNAAPCGASLVYQTSQPENVRAHDTIRPASNPSDEGIDRYDGRMDLPGDPMLQSVRH